MSFSSNLFETPDAYYDKENHNYVRWDDFYLHPITFGWYKGKLYARKGTPQNVYEPYDFTHHKIKPHILRDNSETLDYEGRLWLKTKVISFWDYPPIEEFPKLLDQLDKKFNINILRDPEWKIEIYDPKEHNTEKLSPVKKYIGSDFPERHPKERHILSPLKKDKISVPSGIGSKRYGKKLPLPYRQKMYVEENYYPSLFEKFKEESDPIKDLGIGIPMKEQINIWYRENYPDYPYIEQIALMFSARDGKTEFVKYLLDNNNHNIIHYQHEYALRWAANNGHAEVVKLLLDAGADVHAKNDQALEWASENGHIKIANILINHIKRQKNRVKESINISEKFTKGGDPVTDMGIGLEKQIHDYIDKNDHYGLATVESRAELIATASDLDNETKSNWLEYIFKQGKEDPDSWDMDAVNEMRNLVSFVPYFNLRDYHIRYLHKDNNYTLYVDDWSVFTPYFNVKQNGEISLEFIEHVLEGSAQEYFDTHYYTSITDLNDQVNEAEAQKIFDYLKSICIETSELAKNTKNLQELLELINSNNEFFDIERDLMNALDMYMVGEQENEAYKELVKAIKDRYEISETDYDDVYHNYKMKISKDGLNKLFADYYLADLSNYYYPDSGITYNLPNYGYMPFDFDVNDFIEILDGYM